MPKMEGMALRKITGALGTGSRPDERRAGQISGRGVVPVAKLGALTTKAGISFSFRGIMLAGTPSIKDSDCALATADWAGPQSGTAPLLDDIDR
jgi:hypothetical protein